MNQFTINGKKYKSAEFDYNLICDLQDIGLDMSNFGKRSQSALRAYFALSAGIDIKEAGKEIQEHVVKGGNLEELSNAMLKELEESDFFRSISEREEEETPTNQTKTRTKKITE